ncbi:TorF family putative porin [Roseisolibacter agri]|uniref:TorF family putative porin n=1 Tax=Roseisolibacter agri TaxID=2014610 RepID=UPI0024E11D05|nr:TorF family putative porin [Roseisolibacter agri]
MRPRPTVFLRAPFALGILAGVLPAVSHAQSVLNADVAVASAYVWRGVTFTNRPVIQPDAYVTLTAGRGTVVAGAALNVEPRAYDGARDISVLGAESGTLVTATSLWTEYARPVGIASATLGVAGYVYPHANGIAAAYNTAELYAKLAFGGALAPSLAAYHDVGQVRGTYVEGALRHVVPAGERLSIALGSVVGVNLGQGPDAAGTQTAYFAARGLTHVDLSAAATWTTGATTITPSVHAMLVRDAATRLTAPGEQHRSKLTAGIALGWARTLHR